MSTSTSSSLWHSFLTRSLATRLDTETFTTYIPILLSQAPLSPFRIAEIFLQPTDSRVLAPDPRVPRYLQVLLGLETVNASAILRALLRYSTAGGSQDAQLEVKEQETVGGNGTQGDAKQLRWGNSYSTEEMLFYRLAKFVSSGFAPKGNTEAGELLVALVKWMETSLSAYHATQGMLELGAHIEELTAQIMALGTLAIAVLENELVMNVIAKGRGARSKDLSKALGSFVPMLLQSSPQSAARLELFRTQTLMVLEPIQKKEEGASKEIDEILDNHMAMGGIDSIVVVELPTVNCRAGLYIYLNSLVCIPNVDLRRNRLTVVACWEAFN
jgi:mediator of RNA polymerase II transcription subunit 5